MLAFTYSPGRMVFDGLATSAWIRKVEVVGLIALSTTVALPGKRRASSLEAGPEDLDLKPLVDQPHHPVEVAGGDRDVDAHRVELPDHRQLGVIAAAPLDMGPTRLPSLTSARPIRPSIGEDIRQ